MGATKFVAQDRSRHLCCRYGSLRSALLPATNIPPSASPEYVEVRAPVCAHERRVERRDAGRQSKRKTMRASHGWRARLSSGAYPGADLCDGPECRGVLFYVVVI